MFVPQTAGGRPQVGRMGRGFGVGREGECDFGERVESVGGPEERGPHGVEVEGVMMVWPGG